MHSSTQDLITAVGLNLDASASMRLNAAVGEVERLTSGEAGSALAKALAPADIAADAIEACVLVGVLIEQPGDAILLPPNTVPQHPLLAPWIGHCLGDAISRMLLAGSLWTCLGSAAPEFLSLELTQTAEAFWADVRLQFNLNGTTVGVLALFGPRPADAPIARVVRVSGQALYRLGASIRPAAPALSNNPTATSSAAATVH